jgi:hypothetical protein
MGIGVGMLDTPLTLLQNSRVRVGLRAAWLDSQPGFVDYHEEGGFITRSTTGDLDIIRWPRGATATIRVPAHPGCRVLGAEILATFHTHPNTHRQAPQEPTFRDVWNVANDPNRKASHYLGEYVISQQLVYFIYPNGLFQVLGDSRFLLSENGEEKQ